MKHEEFIEKLSAIPDIELVEMAKKELKKLCASGANSFKMSIPPMLEDTDIILSEIIKRFSLNINELTAKQLLAGGIFSLTKEIDGHLITLILEKSAPGLAGLVLLNGTSLAYIDTLHINEFYVKLLLDADFLPNKNNNKVFAYPNPILSDVLTNFIYGKNLKDDNKIVAFKPIPLFLVDITHLIKKAVPIIGG
jgi:hypothetical protein